MQPETPAQDPPQTAACRRFRLPDEAATRAFARALRPHLRPGDVIVAVARKGLRRGAEPQSLRDSLRKMKRGQSFTIKVIRDGKAKTLKAKMTE